MVYVNYVKSKKEAGGVMGEAYPSRLFCYREGAVCLIRGAYQLITMPTVRYFQNSITNFHCFKAVSTILKGCYQNNL